MIRTEIIFKVSETERNFFIVMHSNEKISRKTAPLIESFSMCYMYESAPL